MTDLFNIAHGAGGLWEVHRWNGALSFNTEAGNDPRYFVQKITGLHSLADRPDNRSPRVARVGENAYANDALGLTRTYDGELVASTVPKLRLARTTLIAAFADTRAEGYMDIIPQAGDSSPTARFYAKALQLDLADEVTADDRGNLHRAFLLGLRSSDPRIYYPSLAVDSTGSPVSVTNPGDAPVDPILTIAGASGAVVVDDGTHTLTFAGVPSGTLVIDFAARTAKVGAVHAQLVAASSDWWDSFVDGIAAGATVSIAQTGGTSVRAQFTPASWA